MSLYDVHLNELDVRRIVDDAVAKEREARRKREESAAERSDELEGKIETEEVVRDALFMTVADQFTKFAQETRSELKAVREKAEHNEEQVAEILKMAQINQGQLAIILDRLGGIAQEARGSGDGR